MNSNFQEGYSSELREELAFEHRKIFFNETVDTDSIYEIVYILQKMLSLESNLEHKPPITIYIDSCGGYCKDGFVLVDLIERMKNQGYEINTVVVGCAYSFGLILALSGTHRYCYKHSDFMYHNISYSYQGNIVDQKRFLERSLKRAEEYKELIINKTEFTKEELQNIDNTMQDFFFSAEEAISYKVCEKIL